MKKILIVDDEKMMLKMATHILIKNYKIIGATSGAEAIELFKKERPDMVLSDLLMPEMDGYTLHHELQSVSDEPVPIMFMTADESDEAESRGFEIGAADYIRKPLKPDVLLRRVGNIIDNLDKIHGLKQAATIDLMTNLLNKAASQRELTKLCSTKHGVLMMIDLDSFKLVNDLYGHAMGDKILIAFADILRHTFRSSDLLGRMGGDEFIAFAAGAHAENEIARKVEQINIELVDVAKRLMGDDMNIPIGTSIGCVFVPDEGTDFNMLNQKADKALYSVKQNGKHGCAFYHEASALEHEETHNLSSMQMILSERNKAAGAYVIEFEQFKAIYRLAARLVDNYQKGIQFLQFTLDDPKDADEFVEQLSHCLRRSDCVTQHGSGQFFVLLMEATTDDVELVKRRVMERWARPLRFECSKVE